jgi:general secretion pathway protein J
MTPTRRGYALIELLVALAIFALLSAMAYSGLDALLRARAQMDDASARLKAVQLAVSVFEREMRNAIARPIRGNVGERVPALSGSVRALELSSRAAATRLGPAGAALHRVAFVFDQGVWTLLRYPVLDRASQTVPTRRVLLEDVQNLRLRYLDHAGRWRDDWPPRDGPEAGGEHLPRAIALSAELQDWGLIERRIELVEGPVLIDTAPAGAAP